jgi:isoquinoline 1-oxidoreductase beta subunit
VSGAPIWTRADPAAVVAAIESDVSIRPYVIRVDRRAFLKATGFAGVGLLLGCGSTPSRTADGSVNQSDFQPSAYLQITRESIRIVAQNPEVGQGVKTSLPMIVAEELDAAWADVEVVQAPIDEARYPRQVAGGSLSIPKNWDSHRQAGAVARAMLVAAAAERWGVPASECTTAESRVLHEGRALRLHYTELADEAARQPVPDASQLVLKKREAYRLLGQRVTGVDNEALVRGEALFGIDHSVPGMKYAVYEKCEATGGKPRAANLDEIKALPGVVDCFVLEGNANPMELMPGVAIVADSTWAALRARKKLWVEWDESEASKDSWSRTAEKARAIATGSGEAAQQSAQLGSNRVVDTGDVDSAFESAEHKVESFYTYHFVSHAQLEPQNCTAHVANGKAELWAPTQTPTRAVTSVANLLGIAESDVTLHQTRCGGGFGRRLYNDFAAEAAAISEHAGVPIKLQWTREDDMRHDLYRAGGFHAMKGGLDRSGRVTAWHGRFITLSPDGERTVTGGGLRAGVFPDGLVEDCRLEETMLEWTTPCGAWRAPGSNVYGFVVQGFLDELAVAAGRDFRELLLETLGEPRWLEPGNPWALDTGRAAGVIRLVSEKAGWGRKMPKGRGLGLGFYCSHGGHVAEVADVSVDAEKRLRVHKVYVAADVGLIVNRSMAENQAEGSIIDGLSTMLAQSVTHENGRVAETNFDRYPLLRMSQAPEVEVHFIESAHPPSGLGEPVLPPLAPAVSNAIYAASGHRVRTLPISEEGFRI